MQSFLILPVFSKHDVSVEVAPGSSEPEGHLPGEEDA